MVDISFVGHGPTWTESNGDDLGQPQLEDPKNLVNRRFMSVVAMQFQLVGKVLEDASTASVHVDDLSAFTETVRQSNVRILKEMNRRPPKQNGGDQASPGFEEVTDFPLKDGCNGLERTPTTGINRPSMQIEVAPSFKSDSSISPNNRKDGSAISAKTSLSRRASMDIMEDLPRTPSEEALNVNAAHGAHRFLQHMVAWRGFDIVLGVVILVNAVAIGAETSRRSEGKEMGPVLVALDWMFYTIYVVELLTRLAAFGMKVFQSRWVKFDCFLVICATLDIILSAELGDNKEDLSESEDWAISILNKIMLVRLLRLLRLAKLVRLMVQFKVLWMLVIGLVHSLHTLFWTFVILVSLIYVFAIMGMEMIYQDPTRSDAFNDAVFQHFGSLYSSCLTLVAGLTIDSLSDVYRPLIYEKPWLMSYFVLYVLIVCIALMNLVTALMVESSMAQAADDREVQHAWELAQKRRVLVELGDLFRQLDEDGSDMVEMTELRAAPKPLKDRLLQLMSTEDFGEVETLFSALDSDASGALTVDEFCQGLSKVLNGTPIELIRIMKQNEELLREQHTTTLNLGEFNAGRASTVAGFDANLDSPSSRRPSSERRRSKQ